MPGFRAKFRWLVASPFVEAHWILSAELRTYRNRGPKPRWLSLSLGLTRHNVQPSAGPKKPLQTSKRLGTFGGWKGLKSESGLRWAGVGNAMSELRNKTRTPGRAWVQRRFALRLVPTVTRRLAARVPEYSVQPAPADPFLLPGKHARHQKLTTLWWGAILSRNGWSTACGRASTPCMCPRG